MVSINESRDYTWICSVGKLNYIIIIYFILFTESIIKIRDNNPKKSTFYLAGMIGTMTLKAGFTVYNPCSILSTYHVHCSRIGTRYVKGHNSIRNQPWSVRNVKTSPPVSELKYGPQKRSRWSYERIELTISIWRSASCSGSVLRI